MTLSLLTPQYTTAAQVPLRCLAPTSNSRVASSQACCKGGHTLTVSTAILLICPTTCSSHSFPHPTPFNSNSIPPDAQVKTRKSSDSQEEKTANALPAGFNMYSFSPPPLHHLQCVTVSPLLLRSSALSSPCSCEDNSVPVMALLCSNPPVALTSLRVKVEVFTVV